MAGNVFWQSGSVFSGVLQASGTGGGILNGAVATLSGYLYNNGNSGFLAFFGTAELVMHLSGWGAAVQSQKTVDFYLLPSRDGVNFPNVDTTNASLGAPYFKGSFVTTTSGNQQDRMTIETIPLMPLLYRGYLINNAGQTMASGWTVNFQAYQEAYT